MKKYRYNGIVRVSKNKARKLHEKGISVALIPCKLRPGYPWFPECWLNVLPYRDSTFDSTVNSFEHYNCSEESGRYAAFYVNESDIA